MNELNVLIQQAANLLDKADLSEFKTTSDKIRHLASLGMPRSEIARTLGIKYQHVRNVLVKPLKQQ